MSLPLPRILCVGIYMIAAWQTNTFRLPNYNKHNMKWLKFKKLIYRVQQNFPLFLKKKKKKLKGVHFTRTKMIIKIFFYMKKYKSSIMSINKKSNLVFKTLAHLLPLYNHNSVIQCFQCFYNAFLVSATF